MRQLFFTFFRSSELSKLELSAKIPRLAPSVRLSLLTTDEPLSPAYVPTDFLIAFLKDLDSLI